MAPQASWFWEKANGRRGTHTHTLTDATSGVFDEAIVLQGVGRQNCHPLRSLEGSVCWEWPGLLGYRWGAGAPTTGSACCCCCGAGSAAGASGAAIMPAAGRAALVTG